MAKKRKKNRPNKKADHSQRVSADLPPYIRRMQQIGEVVKPVLVMGRQHDGTIDWSLVGQKAKLRTEEIEARLAEEMAPYDAFDIVANMLFSNLALDLDAYRESEHQGLLANVEYAASLCLRRRSRDGIGDRDDPSLAGHATRWNDDIRGLMHIRWLGQMASLTTDRSSLARVRYRQFGRELVLRNVAYEWQEEQLLRNLLGSGTVDQDLLRLAGFTIEEALKLAGEISHRPDERMLHQGQEARSAATFLQDQVRARRRGGPHTPSSQHVAALVDELVNLPAKQRNRAIKQTVVLGMWHRVGDLISFTIQELAAAAGVEEQQVTCFLAVFSQTFEQEIEPDPIKAIGAVRARPIMHDGNTYLCVDGGDLLWAIRKRLEERIKEANQDAWHRYDRHRSTVTEQAALRYLSAALHPDEQWHSLKWKEDSQEFQLDGLLLVDTVAITVEVKAGEFTPPARRSAPDRLRRDLTKLIGDAHGQARRARDRLRSADVVEFTGNRGEVIRIDVSNIVEVLPLTITLDDFGAGPLVWELARAEFLQSGEEHPTTMSLYDLELVCDLLDRPALLLHYLSRRQTFNQIGRVVSSEELDLLMYYIQRGLYVEEMPTNPEAPGIIVLSSLTDPVDAYYLYQHGIRTKPATKPQMRLHREIDAIVGFLEQERPPGWTAATRFLLDMHGDEQTNLGKTIIRMRKQTRRDGQQHDISVGLARPDRGLSIVIVPDDMEKLKKWVELLTVKNKHVQRADLWIGIGILANQQEPFQFFLHFNDPWSPDEELDQAIAELTGNATHRPDGERRGRSTREQRDGSGCRGL